MPRLVNARAISLKVEHPALLASAADRVVQRRCPELLGERQEPFGIPRRLVVAAAAEGHHRVKDTADESGRPGGCRPSSGTLIIEP